MKTFFKIIDWTYPIVIGMTLALLFGPVTLLGCILALIVFVILDYLTGKFIFKDPISWESFLRCILTVIGMGVYSFIF